MTWFSLLQTTITEDAYSAVAQEVLQPAMARLFIRRLIKGNRQTHTGRLASARRPPLRFMARGLSDDGSGGLSLLASIDRKRSLHYDCDGDGSALQ